MSVTQAQAWAIFEGEKLGQPESQTAQAQMTDEEMEEYTAFTNEWEMKLAQIGVDAQNEAATIAEDNPTIVAEVTSLEPYNWTADHYVKTVSLFKGSKFEKLHLSAAFRVPNAPLLLELVKP